MRRLLRGVMKNLIKITMCLIFILILSGCESYTIIHGSDNSIVDGGNTNDIIDTNSTLGLINLMTEPFYAEYGFAWSEGEKPADFISKLKNPTNPWTTKYIGDGDIIYIGGFPDPPPFTIPDPLHLYTIPTKTINFKPFIKIIGNIDNIYLFSSADGGSKIRFDLLFVDTTTGYGVKLEYPASLYLSGFMSIVDSAKISADAKKTLGDKYEIFAIVREFNGIPDGPQVPAGKRVLSVEKKIK